MSIGKSVLVLLAGALMVGLVFVGISAVNGSEPEGGKGQDQGGAEPGTPLVQEADGVAIQAVFNPAVAAGQNAIAFEIAMNTHSVELGDIKLARLGKVILAPGVELTELVWTPHGTGRGHHVEGLLMAQDPKGLLASAVTVTLELAGMPGDRTLRYEWKATGE